MIQHQYEEGEAKDDLIGVGIIDNKVIVNDRIDQI